MNVGNKRRIRVDMIHKPPIVIKKHGESVSVYYREPPLVKDEERMNKIIRLCNELGIKVQIAESPIELETRLIITLSYIRKEN